MEIEGLKLFQFTVRMIQLFWPELKYLETDFEVYLEEGVF